MKKFIFSLLLVLSFCFQSTYPLFEGVKQKRQKAMELLRRYKPKELIARFKEAQKARDDARQAYERCKKAYERADGLLCREERVALERAHMKFQRMLVALAVGIDLGVIGIAMVAAAGIGIPAAYLGEREQEAIRKAEAAERERALREEAWSPESPFYEE